MANEITAPITVIVNRITAPVTMAADAYQLAVSEGFIGTRVEWLASLQAPATEAQLPAWVAAITSLSINANGELEVVPAIGVTRIYPGFIKP